jgi:NTE family protein
MSAQPCQDPDDGLAVPRDFAARHGDGLGLGVSLGGGGVYFVAWQVAYLHELAEHGVHLGGADRVVGTSAGSLVAAVVEAGHLSRLHNELKVLARLPKAIDALAPSTDLHPSQLRAVAAFAMAADADPATVRAVGHAALAAQTAPASVMPRNVTAVLGGRRWPSPGLHITCVDAFTSERCVITKAAKVGINRAVAASSAVPGLFAPQPILDRRCMDGGVSGSGIHLDLLAGCGRAVVLCLTDGADITEARMTVVPGAIEGEVDALRDTGTQVCFRTPDAFDVTKLMDPAAVPEAIEMGRRQAAADAAEVQAFLA